VNVSELGFGLGRLGVIELALASALVGEYSSGAHIVPEAFL
jgi:hypothetical protein